MTLLRDSQHCSQRWKAYCEACGSALSVRSEEEAEHLMEIHNDGCPDEAATVEPLDPDEARHGGGRR